MTWRNFKTTLTSKYILPHKDQPELLKHPPEGYDFIKQEHWDAFVRSRLSEEFLVCIKRFGCFRAKYLIFVGKFYTYFSSTYLLQKLRQLQKERQAKSKYKHRLGRKGYAGLREELVSLS